MIYFFAEESSNARYIFSADDTSDITGQKKLLNGAKHN